MNRAGRLTSFVKSLWVGWLAAGVFVSTVTLGWLGYRAIAEWQQSAALLAQRRAEAAVDSLFMAITRDMRRVQTAVLSTLRIDAQSGSTLDLNDVGSAFARYPYPEAFFAGGGGSATDAVTFYVRAERRPSWLPLRDPQRRFPVESASAPDVSRLLLDRIHPDVEEGRHVSLFNITLGGTTYQVVSVLRYTDSLQEHVEAVVGFVVNLDWVREHYFRELVEQVQSMNGGDTGVTLSVIDADGVAVAGAKPNDANAPSSRRTFPMLFFDPSLIALDQPPDLPRTSWTASAIASGDRTLIAAREGARRTLSLAVVGGLVLAAGIVLTLRATQANARLTAMRSDFVSAVTHELKTPIATIRAISETLASGRSSHPEMSREYAQLAVHEAKRLTRLIDNLLAYARITDVTEIYSFEALDVATIAEQSLKEFSSQLATGGFSVTVDIPPDLPLVRADRTSMMLAIGNLLENAIRYSGSTRKVAVSAHASNGSVVLEVADAGTGIPEGDIPHVTRKFFRGTGAISGGSGLGLSIAQRIVSDHAGSLAIRSEVGMGTTVSVTLPSAPIDHA